MLAEVSRLLKPGGCFVFTDPMAADGVDGVVLKPILDRIHLSDLGSPESYRTFGDRVGLTREVWDERTPMLVRHYDRVRQETRRSRERLEQSISVDYLDRMDVGLGHWIEGGQQGWLCWGLMRFRKAI